MDKFKAFLTWLVAKPLWLRAVLLAIMAIALFFLTLSCGQTVRVTVKDTPQGVSISTTQTSKDSSGTNISINPNINFK